MPDDTEATPAKVGGGDVAVTLKGEEYKLVPTPHAMITLSRKAGGLRAVIQGIMGMDIDMITTVIQHGLGPKVVRDLGGADKLTGLIYDSGLTDSSGGLAAKCVTYVSNLSNGGRPLPEDDTGEGDDTPR